MTRVPPNSAQAEQAILDYMMRKNDAKHIAFEQLHKQDFYLIPHRIIFDAMQQLHLEGQPIDLVTVCERLEISGEMKSAGGVTYVSDLRQGFRAHSPQSCIDIIRDRSQRRALIEAAEKIIERAYDLEDTTNIIGAAESSIYEIGQSRTKGMEWAEQSATDAYLWLNEMAEKGGKVAGLPTGFTQLDATLGGMKPGQLIVVAARPSIGKTALAMNIATNVAKKGNVVGVFSLEMARRELFARILCAEGRVNTSVAMRGETSNEQWKFLAKSMDLIGKTDLCSDDSGSLSVSEIRAKLMQVKAQKKRLDLVVIDYLQLMKHAIRKNGTKADEVGETTRMLKLLAKDLEVPIILISQLNRESEKMGEKRPKLSHLRDSGAIEQDADVVILLYREKKEVNELADIDIAKNRNGATGAIKLSWRGGFCRFENHEARFE